MFRPRNHYELIFSGRGGPKVRSFNLYSTVPALVVEKLCSLNFNLFQKISFFIEMLFLLLLIFETLSHSVTYAAVHWYNQNSLKSQTSGLKGSFYLSFPSRQGYRHRALHQANLFLFLFFSVEMGGLTMLPRLVSNSWAQAI